MDHRFHLLQSLNAGDFRHLNGDLESHLKGTAELLKDWGASTLLQTAGLFHAAYGTAGFDSAMVSLEQRGTIADAIGHKEEALVYLYCSCDRSFVFPQLDNTCNIKFRDRFHGRVFDLTNEEASLFCELTVANELELVVSDPAFKQAHGPGLLRLFEKMDIHLSASAKSAYVNTLGEFAKSPECDSENSKH